MKKICFCVPNPDRIYCIDVVVSLHSAVQVMHSDLSPPSSPQSLSYFSTMIMTNRQDYFDSDACFGGFFAPFNNRPSSGFMNASNPSGGPNEDQIDRSMIEPGQAPPSEVDSLIAKKMNNLTIQEREQALDDLHGVGKAKDETPDFVQSCLHQLEDHLNELKADSEAYRLALTMDRDYVCNPKFRLMFLRADHFVPRDAAKRMLNFFDEKKRLFGLEKLVKDITYDDLDMDDRETLHSGCAQISPVRDRSGRQILIFLPKLRKYKTAENVVSTTVALLLGI